MSVRYSQQSEKLNQYMMDKGFKDKFGKRRKDMIQADFDQIFVEFFSKKPFREILSDFISLGEGVDSYSNEMVHIIVASTKGRNTMLRMAQMTGRESFVSNNLFKSTDNNLLSNDPDLNMGLIADLESRSRTTAHAMYFPQWADRAAAAYDFRIGLGHDLADMLPHMKLTELFAVLPHLGANGPEISRSAVSLLTYPYAYKDLDNDDLQKVFAFQSLYMGEENALRLWLREAGKMNLEFVELGVLASYFEIEDPAHFLEEMVLGGDDDSIRIAILVARKVTQEIGVEVFNDISKKALDFLVSNRIFSSEQAMHHPRGGERYATSALEEGLGL